MFTFMLSAAAASAMVGRQPAPAEAAGQAQPIDAAPALLEDLTGLPGQYDFAFPFDGRMRTFRIYIPTGYRQAEPTPIVYFFHGGSGTSAHASRSYHWNEKAEAETFIVVYPDGTGSLQTWNTMHCCGFALRNEVDDVAFWEFLHAEVATRLNLDQDRVYATGMSNGAMMTHLLGSEVPEYFAAIAPVAGTIGGREQAGGPLAVITTPEDAVPILIFHGLLDESVKYFGGRSTGGFPTTRIDLSQRRGVEFWTAANNASTDPDIEISPSGNIVTARFAAGAGGEEVIHVTIRNQGHAWPGGVDRGIGDPPTQEISATNLIWDFFESHRRR